MKEPYIITEESARSELSRLPSEVVATMYYVSKYHEKYKYTQWAFDELKKRNFIQKSIDDLDKTFTEFYDALLNQDDL